MSWPDILGGAFLLVYYNIALSNFSVVGVVMREAPLKFLKIDLVYPFRHDSSLVSILKKAGKS